MFWISIIPDRYEISISVDSLEVRHVVYIIVHNRLSDKTILNIEEQLLQQFFFVRNERGKEMFVLRKFHRVGD
jgi:hypothetical protein